MAYRRLPAAPSLENLKNQAKTLFAAYRSGDVDAISDFAQFHPDAVGADQAKLTDAQLVLARSYRQPSWPRLATTAQIQRALHDDDAEALQRVAAEHHGALRAYSSMRDTPSRPHRFGESRRVTRGNARALLRAHAPQLPVDELQQHPAGPHGDGVVFQYGADCIVKVPKIGHRKSLLMEARIIEDLRSASLPIRVPEPLFIHEKGFYAVYRCGEGERLMPATLERLTDIELEKAIRSVAHFFHTLHTHSFGEDVLALVPQPKDGYDVAPSQTRRRIQFVAEHSHEYDTKQWERRLDDLEPALQQRWAVAQCDPQTSYFLALDRDYTRLSMGSFYDATQHDPAIDLHDFILEIQSDIENPATQELIHSLLLSNYPSDDPHLTQKIAFGLMGYDIRWAHIRVRAQVRRLEKEGSGE